MSAIADEVRHDLDREPLAGPPSWWLETLAGFVADGFDTVVFWPVMPTPDQVEQLAVEVVPHLLRNR